MLALAGWAAGATAQRGELHRRRQVALPARMWIVSRIPASWRILVNPNNKHRQIEETTALHEHHATRKRISN